MTTDVIAFKLGDTIRHVAETFRAISGAPVIDEQRRVIGVKQTS